MKANRNQKQNEDMISRMAELFPSEGEETFQMLALDVIQTKEQPRTNFDEKELKELEDSISELSKVGQGIEGSGILQPLLVRSDGEGGFVLIAGERRLRAAKNAGIELVPTIVSAPMSDTQAYEQSIVENLLRADLYPLEEAKALRSWMDESQISIREAAKRLGKHKNYIDNRLQILNMGSDVQRMVSLRKDTLSIARLIDEVKDTDLRSKFINLALEEKISFRELKGKIDKQKVAAEDNVASFDGKPSQEETEPERSLRETNESEQSDTISIAIEHLDKAIGKVQKLASVAKDPSQVLMLKRHIQRQVESLSQTVERLDL